MWGGQRWWFLMLDFMSHWFSPSISFSPSLFCLHHHPTRLKFTASWASLEVESCTMTPPVWDIPKELRWRKILPVGRTLSSASTHSLCSGEKMARCEIIYRFMDCSHRFALMVRELDGTMIIIKLFLCIWFSLHLYEMLGCYIKHTTDHFSSYLEVIFWGKTYVLRTHELMLILRLVHVNKPFVHF